MVEYYRDKIIRAKAEPAWLWLTRWQDIAVEYIRERESDYGFDQEQAKQVVDLLNAFHGEAVAAAY